MRNRFPETSDASRLSETEAQRVLARATQLDGTPSGLLVADLRAAAGEAGISTRAFDTALAEMGRAPQPPGSMQDGSRARRFAFAALGAVLAAGAGLLAIRATSAPTTPMIQMEIRLGCLAPADAAELARPALDGPLNSIVYSPANTSRVLAIRGTPEQLERAGAIVAKHDAACATAPAN